MAQARPATAVCARKRCGKTFTVNPFGPLPKFCRPACRTMHYAETKRGNRVPFEDRVAARVWQALADADLIPDRPMPPRRGDAA